MNALIIEKDGKEVVLEVLKCFFFQEGSNNRERGWRRDCSWRREGGCTLTRWYYQVQTWQVPLQGGGQTREGWGGYRLWWRVRSYPNDQKGKKTRDEKFKLQVRKVLFLVSCRILDWPLYTSFILFSLFPIPRF